MNTYDNTLYILTQGAYLAKDGERVAVRLDNETRLAVPIHTLGGIVAFGQVTASPFLMGMAAEAGVCMSFFTEQGKFLARVEGPVSGNIRLRKRQYQASESLSDSCHVAASFIVGKFVNQRSVLERHKRDHGTTSGRVIEASRELSLLIAKVTSPDGLPSPTGGLDALRGIEGIGATRYFSAFDDLILHQKEAFAFKGRNRRPPLDATNALLSFVYTLLTHDVRGALEGVGLDPQAGFLHRDRPGRPGLALDMMEELRPILADRLVLSLINRKQVTGRGFTIAENHGVEMDEKTRRTVLTAYQERKREEIEHPFLQKRAPWSLVPHIQARLLARYLRGDLNGYPAFLWK
ncbi:MAG: type I-C CRISPR-associated endonuclease Cas1c [Planctomycetota bacterium]|jgi:CRISPR-associated protein Cas1|nr:type I-C CRISPR-associated endonuclease Cas1c [Planctomycetota bacterium]